jgi:hypothetical protein
MAGEILMTIPARRLIEWLETIDDTREALTLACEQMEVGPLRSKLFDAMLKTNALRIGLLHYAVDDVEVSNV